MPAVLCCAAAQTPPWLEYEGYGMKLTNNVIYDVWGAGLGVNGGYSILMAHNTLYRCAVDTPGCI
jgi:hypothetical protein